MKNFQGITGKSELLTFLEQKGSNHTGGYYHYTKCSSFKSMLESQKIHLSIGSEMNDIMETKKCSTEKWKRLYIASFSYGSSENMAMWAIYGQPFRDALRLRFSWRKINDIVNFAKDGIIYKFIADNKKDKYQPINEKFSIKLVDVAYYKKNSLERNKEILSGKTCSCIEHCLEKEEFAGYLKNCAWSYENETRIVVEFEKELDNVATIAIDAHHLFDDMDILVSPCAFADNTENNFADELKKYRLNFSNSAFHGLVHFRQYCKSCEISDNNKQQCPYRIRNSKIGL